MLFNTIQFWVFFPVAAIVYFLLPFKIRYLWLLAASYFFYMCWDPRYALLMLLSTAITYASGLLIGGPDSHRSTRGRKIVVFISFFSNLAILFFFKYFYFALANLNTVLGFANLPPITAALNVVLPVGISFYTFQALSYTMDVYRGDMEPEKNFFMYALFVSFFPQLVAGPIERTPNLLRQLKEPKRFNYTDMKNGLMLMLWGLFLKMVIADRAAIWANTVYDSYASFTGYQLSLATFAFAIQIYCDFSSYSIIASGAAQVMGIRLMENFNTPYFAVSVADFWHRWHISLSTWFRDYLYFPLGGSRKGKARKYLNTMIVFLVSGIWHGAAWKFVIWGALNGIYQVTGEITAPLRKKLFGPAQSGMPAFSRKLLAGAGTFLLVCISWVFFRADNAHAALDIFRRIVTDFGFSLKDSGLQLLQSSGMDGQDLLVFAVSLVLLLAVSVCKYKRIRIREALSRQALWFRWIIYLGAIILVMVFGLYGAAYDESAYIYFQF